MNEAFDIVRHPRARRTRLSIDPASGRVRLTLPARQPIAQALRWAEEHRGWIDAERARLPVARPFMPGASFAIGDETLTIAWQEEWPRRVVRDGDTLRCGGPIAAVNARILAWAKREALAVLSAETAAFAARAGVKIARVSVGDPRSRWGSCSASGIIRYSWRLILAPDAVRRATVAHEVAHRLHMNHGPEFHAAVAALGVDAVAARAWLRRHGAGLHWLGRTS